MLIANRPLNTQAIILEEAETQIRETVKTEYLRGSSKTLINKKIETIIKRETDKITIPKLKQLAIISLVNFYKRQYLEISRISTRQIVIIGVLYSLLQDGGKPTTTQISALRSQGIILENNRITVATQNLYGVPLQKYAKDYIEKNVNPVIENLSKQYPYDPESGVGQTKYVNSLRSRAELEVRYDEHVQEIDGLKNKGVKLVIASTHADCSERCAPYQGRVYSLDGTSGITSDGRKYVPLEEATDVLYTTKSGKTYKNGLLGYNCRHYLIPYQKGYEFPKPNVKQERKEYAITIKQRELERNVREWRTRAVENKGVNVEKYNKAKEKAIEWNKAYIEFSKKNGRAYYPSRTKII